MKLVIVESPTKARTLARFLGNEYKISPTMGHIRDLPKNSLGVDVENDFKPDYVLLKERRKQVKEIQSQAKGAQRIILATDPDREGEAIAYHVMHILHLMSKVKGQRSNVKRIVFHEITKQAIKEALKNPKDVDMKLVDAQQARRVLDRLVGYKLSPLLWYKVRKGLSAGRVQSVALRLIVERERETEAFVPEEYWVIEAELQKRQRAKGKEQNSSEKVKTDQTFLAKLVKKEGKKFEVKDKKTADSVVSDLKKASYMVKDIKKKEVRRYPYPPFTTSTMQQTASTRFGWTAKKTMQLAQKLYEEGYITYHRTDSTTIAKEALRTVRTFILKNWGKKYLPPKPRLYKTKSKVAQEAHEAIRPTSVQIAPMAFNQPAKVERLPQSLGREASRLYTLIWKRYISSQMKEAVYNQTKVDIAADRYTLRAIGLIIIFAGWKVIYQEASRKQKARDEERHLPALEEGELLDLVKLLPRQKFSQPPPRYNEALLIKTLEEKGIGRPSTYAPIISTISSRQYVERVERRFKPTALGVTVNDFLVKYFPDVVDVSFTAKMEDDLDSIARGETHWTPVIHHFYQPFSKRLTKVYKQAQRVKVKAQKTNENCPECGSPLVVRIGKYGKFIACSTFPACKFTKQYLEKTGIACPKCGGEIVLKKTKRGKRFYGCRNYPKCDFASWKKPEDLKKAADSA